MKGSSCFSHESVHGKRDTRQVQKTAGNGKLCVVFLVQLRPFEVAGRTNHIVRAHEETAGL
jgi:hypothetical protein